MVGNIGNHLTKSMTEQEEKDFFRGLLERAEQKRLEWLFEEPSTYEDDDTDELDN
jgi:hypothetical protein